MGQLNLKANSHKVRPFIVRHIDDKSAGQIVQNVCGYCVILFRPHRTIHDFDGLDGQFLQIPMCN